MTSHLISWMIGLPFFGALLQIFLRENKNTFLSPKSIALFFSVMSSVAGFFSFYLGYLRPEHTAVSETTAWIETYSIFYSVQIGGLNVLSILLISIVFPLIILSEWKKRVDYQGILGLYLLLQATLIGAVCSQDMFSMFFFWSLSAFPVYFLVAYWGGTHREKAASSYILTAALGNAFFLAALFLVYYSQSPHTFSLSELSGGVFANKSIGFLGIQMPVSLLAFVLFTLAFAFRMPVWPLNQWFSTLLAQAPCSTVVFFAGVFVPVSLVIYLNIVYSLFPTEVIKYSNVMLILGAMNMFVASLGIISKKTLWSFLASLSLLQMGFFLVGIGSVELSSVLGLVLQATFFGVAISALGFIWGAISSRVGTDVFSNEEDEKVFGGIAAEAPILALFCGLTLASLLGVPGLSGFVGNTLIVMGGAEKQNWLLVLVGIVLLFMVYSVFGIYRTVFLGQKYGGEDVSELSIFEKMYIAPLVFFIIVAGIYPRPFFEAARPAVTVLLSMMK